MTLGAMALTGLPVSSGVWTPSLGGTATYTTQVGTYKKIGPLVYIFGRIVVNVLGTGSAFAISGVPFSATQLAPIWVGYYTGLAISTIFLNGYITGTTVNFNGQEASDGTQTNAVAPFGNGAQVIFSCMYETS